MPTTRNPRRGSMQFWPRKRARRIVTRLRSKPVESQAKLVGFAGYKVGMTHLMVTDNRAHTPTKGKNIMMPATVIECPPIKVFGVNSYKKTPYGLTLSSTILSSQNDKELSRKIPLPKKAKHDISSIKAEDCVDIRLLVYTQPKLTSLGKKKPELFELPIGGNVEDQLNFAKGVLGKEIRISDVFKEGAQIDMHAVTKGKGFQGPVRRFGIKIRFHKSEKTKRGPGSLGSWGSPTTYRVAHAGQMGYHQRTEYNKWIVKMDSDAKKINPKGSWLRYGPVKNDYILVKGSLPGPSKRLITITKAQRPSTRIPKQPPQINYTSLESRQ